MGSANFNAIYMVKVTVKVMVSIRVKYILLLLIVLVCYYAGYILLVYLPVHLLSKFKTYFNGLN